MFSTIIEVNTMVRVCYESSISEFIDNDESYILGELTKNFSHDLVDLQKNAWISEINILKKQLSSFNGDILFEYNVPRMESVIDNVFLIDGLVFVVEFKVGETEYKSYEIEQVERYIHQLRDFHYESQDKVLVPILVSTEAEDYNNDFIVNDDIFNTILANKENIGSIIRRICEKYRHQLDLSNWSKSKYKPSPTILQAARELYETHEVDKIKTYSSDYSIFVETEETIDNIIKNSKEHHRKSIIFLTGVPGAGKTLVGSNIATKRSVQDDDHAVFLSGNGPLVKVLREALSRDSYKRNKETTTKQEAKNKVFSFIQPVHQFRNDAIEDEDPINEKIVIFDEAQRAWTEHQTEKFMKNKFSIEDFGMSEPEFLISIMDRHEDWAVIICLVGQGQEINTGEAGISEWFKALNNQYQDWDIYTAEDMESITTNYHNITVTHKEELYLGITQRSVEAPTLPQFIEYLLENDKDNAINILGDFNDEYPLFITRDFEKAKKWIKEKTIDDDVRCGLLAQSNALRLIPEGIFVKNDIKVEPWFLNESEDVRSSNHLEISATEFDIQGLEIDYSIVAWDANLRYNNGKFEHYKFKGTKWNKITDENLTDKNYLINSYRVLLTRARSGMVIFVPEGDDTDKTRLTEYYDGTYEYLKSLGINELEK